jgi:hypothetical protein
LLHSLGLKGDGSIVGWGNNDFGQTNVSAPNTGFVAVAAGGFHSLGLKADGSIVTWGCGNPEYNYGQCNVPAPNAEFIGVAAGNDHSLGLKADGSIVAWGSDLRGQINVSAPNTGFVAVAAGAYHNLAIREATDEFDAHPLRAILGDVDKVRNVSFRVPPPVAPGEETAIRVTLTSLMHPNPSNLPQFPSPNFTAFEGQVRWVGPVGNCVESEVPPVTFQCANLQCTPNYQLWPSEAIHVTGTELVPSSTYILAQLPPSCTGSEATCTNVSADRFFRTQRWGDVVAPFQDPNDSLSQPNIMDVAGVVDKFKGVASAPIMARSDLAPDDPNGIVNIVDVANTVDAFKNFAYPYAGPTNCP